MKACFDMHGKAFLPEARDMLKNFEEDISVSGIASINEIYDGDPPGITLEGPSPNRECGWLFCA